MKQPLIISRPGMLDVFDNLDDVRQQFPLDALAGKDVAVWDGEGRKLTVHRGPGGELQIESESPQESGAEELAQILRQYLERGGMSADQSRLLPLNELIVRIYSHTLMAVSPCRQVMRGRRGTSLFYNASRPGLLCVVSGGPREGETAVLTNREVVDRRRKRK